VESCSWGSRESGRTLRIKTEQEAKRHVCVDGFSFDDRQEDEQEDEQEDRRGRDLAVAKKRKEGHAKKKRLCCVPVQNRQTAASSKRANPIGPGEVGPFLFDVLLSLC